MSFKSACSHRGRIPQFLIDARQYANIREKNIEAARERCVRARLGLASLDYGWTSCDEEIGHGS